ncbi:MAG TPA: PEGA domain-containing protein [Polyangiaceae bacterium]|nr:PEGA domain-containing protein [Polyangiaceae bacterium]
MMRRGLGLLLLAAALAAPSPAFAQSSADLARAKDLFRAGASAYGAGDYLAAIQALAAAYELTPLPAIAFSLAQAERKQYFVDGRPEHLEQAVRLFQRYLDEAPAGGRRADAREALSQLEPLLTKSRPGEAPHKQAERPTRLMIVAEAPGARIALDGAAPAPSPLIREVTPGKHRVRVEAPGHVSVEREAIAVAGELILTDVRLADLPSTISVYTPADSDVYVDGAFAGQSDDHLTLELSAGRHQITVARKGHRLAEQTVTLERGKASSVRLTPECSTQRTVSMVLLASGGGALGAGLITSALAVRSENRAEEFLGAQSRHNVSGEELAAYRASVNERDRFRTASTIAFASAAGLFITGLFLHELDHPDPEKRRGEPASPSHPPIRVLPQVGASSAGALLQGSF